MGYKDHLVETAYDMQLWKENTYTTCMYPSTAWACCTSSSMLEPVHPSIRSVVQSRATSNHSSLSSLRGHAEPRVTRYSPIDARGSCHNGTRRNAALRKTGKGAHPKGVPCTSTDVRRSICPRVKLRHYTLPLLIQTCRGDDDAPEHAGGARCPDVLI